MRFGKRGESADYGHMRFGRAGRTVAVAIRRDETTEERDHTKPDTPGKLQENLPISKRAGITQSKRNEPRYYN